MSQDKTNLHWKTNRHSYAKKISQHSGDERETVFFLLQRVSALVQRYNSVLLHDSFVREDLNMVTPTTFYLLLLLFFDSNPDFQTGCISVTAGSPQNESSSVISTSS